MNVPLEQRVQDLRDTLRQRVGHGEPLVVVSPYRICPIGAHVDHQGGPVLGTAIDAETLLAFLPSDSEESRLDSANFPGSLSTTLSASGDPPEGWARYFWAASQALLARPAAQPRRGIIALAEGSLPGGGLSSSASVVLAYLTALANVNDIELDPRELIELARHCENAYVGVKCGLLDPACIVASRRDHLVSIDTKVCSWEAIPGEHAASRSRFLVAFSGVERNLLHTGFNDRVDQCHEAARHLGELSGNPDAQRLGDHKDEIFNAHIDALPPLSGRRARHFFEERRRVSQGVEAWRGGDLERFGRLMSDSCRSSIQNFEVGSPEIMALHELIETTPGVYGARFSGAGFGGCVVALVEAGRAEECRERIERSYRRQSPELSSARVFLARSRDGLRIQ